MLGALCSSACMGAAADSAESTMVPPGSGGSGAFSSGAAAGLAGSVAAGSAAVAGVAGAGGQPGLPLANTPLTFATAVCEKIWLCCEMEERAMLVAGMTPQDCADAFQASLALDVAEYMVAVAANRAIYDGVMFEACLRDYGERGCDVIRADETIQCFDAVRPLVAWGGSCGADFECIDGYCDGGSGSAYPDGKCAARKQNDAVCRGHEECGSGHCDVIRGCADAPAPVGLCGG